MEKVVAHEAVNTVEEYHERWLCSVENGGQRPGENKAGEEEILGTQKGSQSDCV
jgi:hypothetical protein